MILHTVDALPENFISNSWAFQLDSVSGAGTVLTPILKAFYDSLNSYFSPLIAQNGHDIKYSHLPGTPPNYPFEEDVWNFASAPSGTAIPEELAVCLSFQGIRTAGYAQARRRGRIYVGPFDGTALTATRPTPALITAMGTAAATLKSSVGAIGGTSAWTVWSPTDAASVEVNDGWIDNAFDIQRRRGTLSSSRTTFV